MQCQVFEVVGLIVGKLCKYTTLYITLYRLFYITAELEQCCCDRWSSLHSSDILYSKFGDFLADCNLSKVKGCKTRSHKFLTLLKSSLL